MILRALESYSACCTFAWSTSILLVEHILAVGWVVTPVASMNRCINLCALVLLAVASANVVIEYKAVPMYLDRCSAKLVIVTFEPF